MSKMSAIAYGQLAETVKEKVIFRREYDPYMKVWGYVAGFPNQEANRGRIAIVSFKLDEDGKAYSYYADEADKFYFTKLKLVHKGTDEAEKCLDALKKMYPEDEYECEYFVAEKIVKGDRCY